MSEPSNTPTPPPDPRDAEVDADREATLDDDPGAWPERDWAELTDYLGGDGTPAVRAATAQRLQTDRAFARLAAPLLALWQSPLPGADADLDAAWAAIQRKAAASQTTPSAIPSLGAPPRGFGAPAPAGARAAPRRWYRPPVALQPVWAIALLMVIIVGNTRLYLAQRPRDRALKYYTAPLATEHTVTLADGSTVTLTPGSTLVTDGLASSPHAERSRLVHLDGTGMFVVHADPAHPFIVETQGISAVAVGTAFQVAAHPGGGGNPALHTAPASSPSSSPAAPSATVSVSVTSGTVMVQQQDAHGHRQTLAVLGPGQETSVQTFTRYFKAGWAAAAAHKSVAEAYLEYQAMQAADSARAHPRRVRERSP